MTNYIKVISSIDEIEDGSTYFVLEIEPDGQNYAYYATGTHFLVCAENGDYKDHTFIDKRSIDNDCNLEHYVGPEPVIHVVEVDRKNKGWMT